VGGSDENESGSDTVARGGGGMRRIGRKAIKAVEMKRQRSDRAQGGNGGR
jgi:hypothetical protein